MPGPEFVAPGTPITAKGQNALIGAVRQVMGLNAGAGLAMNRGYFGATVSATPGDFSRKMLCINDAGQDIPAFSIVVVNQASTNEGTNSKYRVIKTSGTFSTEFIVTGSDVITVGGTGVCYDAADWCYVTYDSSSGTPTFGQSWGPAPNNFKAFKNYPGLIVRGIVDSANSLMLCRREFIDQLIVKTTSAVGGQVSGPPISTLSYTIYAGVPGSRVAVSGWITKPTVYNYGPAISTGKWCAINFVGGEWIIAPLECG